MKTQTYVSRSTLFLVLLLTILLAGCASGSDPNATGVETFADYQSWTRVNSEPITSDTTGSLGLAHEGTKGIREVYINDTGKAVSTGSADYPYPAGSIIVKEAFTSDGAGNKGALSSITVMVKREAGYDAENGDWEYVNVRPDLRVRAQGRIGMCIKCHGAAVLDDFVFTSAR